MPAPTPETKPLVIGLVLDDGLDAPDGVQQYVLTLARELAARGHEVHLVASTTSRADLDRLHVLGRNLRVRFNGNVLSSPLPARAVPSGSHCAYEAAARVLTTLDEMLDTLINKTGVVGR